MLVAAAGALAASTAGCGDRGPGGVGTAGGALAALPDPGEQVFAVFTDWQRAAEVAGVEPPGDRASGDDEIEFLRRITGFPGDDGGDGVAGGSFPRAVIDFTRGLDDTSLRDEAGIGLGDIHAFAELQNFPEAIVVLSGSFDTRAMTDALGADPDDDGFVVLGEEGESDPDEQGLLRGGLGAGVVVAPSPSRVVVARTAELAEAATGDGERLAADEDLATVAAVLDDEGAYAGFLVRAEGQDFEAQASAVAEEDGRHVLLIVFAYDEPEAAEDHRDFLEDLLDDGGRSVEQLEDPVVEVRDGTVVVLRALVADGVRPTLWEALLAQFDPLVRPPSDDD